LAVGETGSSTVRRRTVTVYWKNLKRSGVEDPIMKLLRFLGFLVGTAVALATLWAFYGTVSPEKPPYSDHQRQMAEDLGQAVQDWLPTIPASGGRAVFGNLESDDFGLVSHPVRAALWRSARFDLAGRGVLERVRERINWTIPVWEVGEDLSDYARHHHARWAIGGTVLRLADDPQRILQVRLDVVEVATGRMVASHDFTVQPNGVDRAVARVVPVRLPAHVRIMLWIGLVVLLPLCVLPFARDLLVDGSNTAILLTLLGLVGLDVIGAYLLYLSGYDNWLGIGVGLAVLALSLAFNLKYLTVMKAVHL